MAGHGRRQRRDHGASARRDAGSGAGRGSPCRAIPMTSVAEPLKPPAMYDWFVAQREAMGLTIVPLGPDASGVLLRTLRAGKLVGLLCDRDIAGQRRRGRVLRRAHHVAGRSGHAGAAHRGGPPAHRRLQRARAGAAPRRDHAPRARRAHRVAAGRRGPGHPARGQRPREAHPTRSRAVAPLPAQLAERRAGVQRPR